MLIAGRSFTDPHVCAGCVDDYAFAAAIIAAEEPDEGLRLL